jgi:hypothetical protein
VAASWVARQPLRVSAAEQRPIASPRIRSQCKRTGPQESPAKWRMAARFRNGKGWWLTFGRTFFKSKDPVFWARGTFPGPSNGEIRMGQAAEGSVVIICMQNMYRRNVVGDCALLVIKIGSYSYSRAVARVAICIYVCNPSLCALLCGTARYTTYLCTYIQYQRMSVTLPSAPPSQRSGGSAAWKSKA